jgi:YesN/AraC family two-component response regulator
LAKSILIIDDDRDFRTALRQVFECHEYKVNEACNGKDGIESYRRIATDIVITDIYMPEKDGLETILDLKKEFPEVKIIAMSGIDKGGVDFFQVARHLGATDCIRKPFEPYDIIRKVNLTLDGNIAEGTTP